MSSTRPDPDSLLARVHREEAEKKRGKLTIFFGAAPFAVIMFIVLLLVIAFPWLATGLL